MKQQICDICGKECRFGFDIDCYATVQSINLCYECGKPLLDIINNHNENYKIILKGGSE